MILITHPRCGSEWFFDCVETDYPGWELFGKQNRSAHLPQTPVLTNAQKLDLLQSNQSQKIMLYALIDEADPAIMNHLRARDDVYLLRRRNVRASILSLQIAARNDLNFHGDVSKINKPVNITYEMLVRWNHNMNLIFDQDLDLRYTEQLWYEDLISGYRPNTLQFDALRSNRPIRHSAFRFKSLVLNLDQVEAWMNELQIPGTLT